MRAALLLRIGDEFVLDRGSDCSPIVVSLCLKYPRFEYNYSLGLVLCHPELAGDSDSHVRSVSYNLPSQSGKLYQNQRKSL